VGVGLAICAPWLVPLMLGDKWLDTIPIIQVFSIAGVIRMLSVGAGSIFLTLNRLRLQFILTLTALSVSIPVVTYLVINNGILGASMGMLLLVSISSVLQMVAIYRLLNIPWHYGIKYIYRPLVSVSVMVVLLQLLKVEILPDPITIVEIITQLIIVVFAGAFVYVSMLIVMWKLSGSPESSERVVLSHVYKFTKRYMGNLKIGR
jgi:PST family polysaccharide transporter